ncbi:hypothetical protein BD408DRAFT_425524 [Parasitella parasitica]|nr:hypothetical protein BD408DRAFT_425524 [Parasitella parasitica]
MAFWYKSLLVADILNGHWFEEAHNSMKEVYSRHDYIYIYIYILYTLYFIQTLFFIFLTTVIVWP